MESYLKRTAEATESFLKEQTRRRVTYSIDLDGKTPTITTRFKQKLTFDPNQKYEMALINLNTYYSFPNVTAENNKFTYSVDNGVNWKLIEIAVGAYEIGAINEYIQRVMKQNGDWDSANSSYYITIIPDVNTLKSVLNITNATYQVDFTVPGSINTLLGFDSGIYTNGYNISQQLVNIISITQFYIYNNLIQYSTINGVPSNSIYSFFPNVGPGYKIIEEPANIIYYPIFTGNDIEEMTTTFVDQTGKLIDLRGETLTINFHIREMH